MLGTESLYAYGSEMALGKGLDMECARVCAQVCAQVCARACARVCARLCREVSLVKLRCLQREQHHYMPSYILRIFLMR